MILIDSTVLTKVTKAIVSLAKKEDLVKLYVKSKDIELCGEYFKFNLFANSEHVEAYECTLQVSDLLNISKLTKKEQGDVIKIDIENNKFILDSGISFSFKPYESESPSLRFQDSQELVYLDSTQVTALSRCVQKQKDYEWMRLYQCGALAIGQFQISYISFFEPAEAKSESKPIKFSNTQLNNLVKVGGSGEIGIDSENAVFGFQSSANLVGYKEPSFETQFKAPDKTKLSPKKHNFVLNNWLEIKKDVQEQSQFSVTVQNTKQIEKLISNSKVTDVYDLCSLNFDTGKLDINFYQGGEVRSSLNLEIQNDGEQIIYLQTKHMISLFQFANNELTITYSGGHLPIYISSDLGIESLVMQSQVI